MQLNVMAELLNALRSQLLGIFHDFRVNGIRMSIFSYVNRTNHSREMIILPLP